MGLNLLFSDFSGGVLEGIAGLLWGVRREQVTLKKAILLLHELEETLSVGLVPTPERWQAMKELSRPWGPLSYESLIDLRNRGASLLPTMKRLRTLAADHLASLSDARARSAQALAQAGACGVLVPVFGTILYFLLPGLSERGLAWVSACGLAMISSAIAMLWLFNLAEGARWGGLTGAARAWVLASYCAGERFLALIRAGNPADISWSRAVELLGKEAPGLALEWGQSVWDQKPVKQREPAQAILIQAGADLRKAVQVSLMEGRPCLDRVEAVLSGLKSEMRAQVDRELSLLATRALKPLFICVAPALLGLLAFGLLICWQQQAMI